MPTSSLLALVALLAGHEPGRLTPAQQRWYAAVRPAEAEQKWKRIPWETDLMQAVEAARKEKRPLLLWAAFDEPLDRC